MLHLKFGGNPVGVASSPRWPKPPEFNPAPHPKRPEDGPPTGMEYPA